VLQEFDQDAPARLEAKLALAQETFQRWRRTSFSERAELLTRAAAVLEADEEALAGLMTLEMGKPIAAARQEIRKCALCCRYYAEQAETLLRDEPVASNDARCWVKYQPLGAVLAVMPWNFPFWQVFRFAAPSLMAGNVGLLKHASNVPQCALVIESVFVRAGLPAGAFQTLLIDSEAVGRVIADARVRAVTLTGSLGAGSAVAALAGRHIKKSVLELGGSDPFIVMPSTDLQRAAAAAVQARTINNGQSCIAAKRFLVHRKVIAEFQGLFVERMAGLKIGDPMDPLTEIGPLATAGVRDDIERQVGTTVDLGAKLLLGGERLPGPGYFFLPTVLADIPPQSPAAREELFGPVACLFEVEDLQHALKLANDSDFGLGASLWTEDPREQELFIEEIEAGAAFVNGIVVSDNRLPFGGIKQSGYGRELSYQGLREFVNVKTVWVRGGCGA
jgi:succinate-semialdehyde dehydrogenase/glutarate-semialdehyde dehydrogenase